MKASDKLEKYFDQRLKTVGNMKIRVVSMMRWVTGDFRPNEKKFLCLVILVREMKMELLPKIKKTKQMFTELTNDVFL